MQNGQARSVVLALFAALACFALACAAPAAAQEEPEPARPAAPRAAPSVSEAQPPLYYLRDKKTGALQPVPGFNLDDFEEMVRQKHRLQPGVAGPRWSLQSAHIEGTAKDEHAELKVQFRILVLDDGWVRVPLRLDQAALRGPPQSAGAGQQFLQFEPGSGYVCHIRSAAGQQHQLTLEVLAPLAALGQQRKLRLDVAPAARSELRLKVPIEGAAGEVSEGAMLGSVASRADGTTFTVLGLGSDFALAWHKPGAAPAGPQTALAVAGTLVHKIDDRGIAMEARLTVRPSGAALDRFQVRLPRGAAWAPVKAAHYTVAPLVESGPSPPATKPGEAEQGPVVEVRLAKKTSEAVEVKLAARRGPDVLGAASWCELGGFEVLGAARQTGHVAVVVHGDWRLLWGTPRGVSRVDELPEPLLQTGLAAGFQYHAQPFSLPLRIVPRQTFVSVEPEYTLTVEPDQVLLAAKLKYNIRGAKIGLVDVDLPGWRLDEIGPDDVVAVEGVSLDGRGALTVPVLSETAGRLEVQFRARQKTPASGGTLALELPRPRADACAPATIVVQPAADVELRMKESAMPGMTRQAAGAAAARPRPAGTVVYRGEGARLALAAEFRVRGQAVALDVESRVELDDQAANVEQRLRYDVAFKPLDRLTIEMPRALAQGPLEILVDGQAASFTEVGEPADVPDADQPVSQQLVLPTPRLGPCEVRVRYRRELSEFQGANALQWKVPLVMPGELPCRSNRLTLSAAKGLRMQPRGEAWKPAAGAAPWQGPDRCELASGEKPLYVEFALGAEGQDLSGASLVHRAWVQTRLTRDRRQDRAVFRFSSPQKSIELVLPTGASAADAELVLDGQPVAAEVLPEGRLRIPLSGGPRPQRVLEAAYRFSAARPDPGRMSLEMPRLGSGLWVQRAYWQLLLPRQEHLLGLPADWTPEFRWGWGGLLAGRQPSLESSDLEGWAGGRRLGESFEGVNRYLFSATGTVPGGEFRTIDRATAVLLASGLALAAGLLMIYVRPARRGVPLLLAAIALGALAILFPEPMVVLAQAAGLGVVLALVAWLLSWALRRRTAEPALPPPAVDLPLAPPAPPAAPSEPVSTAAAPVIGQPGEATR